MLPYFTQKFGNSASQHYFGRQASQALEKSRQTIARALNAKPQEIIFTSSATESNNLALKGVAFANQNRGKHLIVSSIEHECVLNSARWLTQQGFQVTYLPVDHFGLINLADLKKAITKSTILVSVMHANNEIGTIEPIEKISQLCRQKGVYFHTDAAQTFGKLPLDVQRMKIDLLTASSHKMYGPKGAALLYVRRGLALQPLFHGGGHERNLRSSTVNLAAIVGFARAVDLCQKEMKKESIRLTKLRDCLIKGILSSIPHTQLNGHPRQRLPNNVNFSFAFVEGEAVMVKLDLHGFAVSTTSACASAKLEPSHVLLACGLKPSQAHGSLRITLGRWTTSAEIDHLLQFLPRAIKQLRQLSPFQHVSSQGS